MKNESDLPDADAENEELLQELEFAAQKLQSSSQQVAELTRQLAETAMARVVGHRRIDLRALRSLDLKPGKYEISTSEPEDPQPQVTLTWIPGTLVLGPDLIPTDRDIHLPLPAIRESRTWPIPPPADNTLPPSPLPKKPGPESEAEQAAWARQYQTRRQAWLAHHRTQTQAAEQLASADQHRASRDEAVVAEAMMSEIEARRANPKENARRTIMEVGTQVATRLVEANRNNPD